MSDHTHGNRAPRIFDAQQLALLRTSLQGSVFIPGDEGYDQARQTWDVKTFDQHPALVVLPTTAADVQAAVTFARQHDLPIAVQGGGHGHFTRVGFSLPSFDLPASGASDAAVASCKLSNIMARFCQIMCRTPLRYRRRLTDKVFSDNTN